MEVSPLIAWYDLWVGFFWDSKKHWLYVLPIPCVGFILKFDRRYYSTKSYRHLVKASQHLRKARKECVGIKMPNTIYYDLLDLESSVDRLQERSKLPTKEV